ncbi:MAG: MotA/TolQ/ExbB proton channel family protein [Lachnospiraceae bacterium]|nr:MotA/TolQ/ExbB proton channel family protein [Lachnospiraceae bacterium]
MDLASLIGFVGCFGMILVGIATSAGFANIGRYADIPSVVITIGGSIFATMTMFSMKDFVGSLKTITMIFKSPTDDIAAMIKKIIDLSNVARKEGLLSLEEAAGELDDAFMKKGILLIVDGTDPELVRGILETEMVSIEGRHKAKMKFWDSWGTMGPAWGMIGTLLGLVNMLYEMDDPSSIGPSMAVALITTLYGSVLANWVCAPVSGKLGANNDNEMMMKEIMIEGLLSIQAGENPRVIEEKLKSFLAPAERAAASAEEGGGGDG